MTQGIGILIHSVKNKMLWLDREKRELCKENKLFDKCGNKISNCDQHSSIYAYYNINFVNEEDWIRITIDPINEKVMYTNLTYEPEILLKELYDIFKDNVNLSYQFPEIDFQSIRCLKQLISSDLNTFDEFYDEKVMNLTKDLDLRQFYQDGYLAEKNCPDNLRILINNLQIQNVNFAKKLFVKFYKGDLNLINKNSNLRNIAFKASALHNMDLYKSVQNELTRTVTERGIYCFNDGDNIKLIKRKG